MNLLSLCFRHNQRNLPPPPPHPPPHPTKHCLLLVVCLCVPPRGVFECGRSDPGSVRSSTCCVNGRFTTEQTTRVCFTLFFFFFFSCRCPDLWETLRRRQWVLRSCSLPRRCVRGATSCFLLSFSVFCCRWIGRCQCFVYFSTYRWNKDFSADNGQVALECSYFIYSLLLFYSLLLWPASTVVV